MQFAKINNGESVGGTGGDKPVEDPFKPTTPPTPNPNNPLQTGSDGVERENPFANTNIYPVIKVGYNNEVYLNKLSQGLRNKKCMSNDHWLGTTYGEEDTNHVRDFQKANGLTDDGVVGKDTWEALSVQTGQKTTFTGIIVKDCK